MQSLQADSENLGGTVVVVGGLERFYDQQSLSLAYSRANPDANRIGIIGRETNRYLPEARRQMFGFDHWAFADDHRALQSIAQLANVSRPGMVAKCVEHGFADGGDATAVLGAHLGEQGVHKIGNVLAVLPERRHVNIEN